MDSKETRETLRFAKALFDEGMTAEVFSWDDAFDNRYWPRRGLPDPRCDLGLPDDRGHQPSTCSAHPPGNGTGRSGRQAGGACGLRRLDMIWKFSKNQQGAKEFLAHLMDNARRGHEATSRGYNMPYLAGHYRRTCRAWARPQDPGPAGQSEDHGISATPARSPRRQEVVDLFVIPDMFTRVARGQTSKSHEVGVGEYRRIYTKHKAERMTGSSRRRSGLRGPSYRACPAGGRGCPPVADAHPAAASLRLYGCPSPPSMSGCWWALRSLFSPPR